MEILNYEVCIHIKYTGRGILEEDLSVIFESLYKIDKARGRSGGGNRGGLRIVKKL